MQVNESGFPTAEGLLSIYTEGVTDKDYYLATAMSIYSCLQASQKKHADSPQSLEGNGSLILYPFRSLYLCSQS